MWSVWQGEGRGIWNKSRKFSLPLCPEACEQYSILSLTVQWIRSQRSFWVMDLISKNNNPDPNLLNFQELWLFESRYLLSISLWWLNLAQLQGWVLDSQNDASTGKKRECTTKATSKHWNLSL